MSQSDFCMVQPHTRPSPGAKVAKHFKMEMAFEVCVPRHVEHTFLKRHGTVPVRFRYVAYNDIRTQGGEQL